MEYNIEDLDESFRFTDQAKMQLLDRWIKIKQMLPMGRQMGTTLAEVKEDHKQRYIWAIDYITKMGFKNILDMGCGTGYGSNMMSQYVDSIDAVDISTNAKKVYDEHWKNDKINYIQSEVFESKDKLKDKYDCIVCFEFVEHIQDSERLLKWFGEISDAVICSVPNQTVHPYVPENQIAHFRHYTPEDFTKLVEMGGFEVVKCGCQTNSKLDTVKDTKVVDGFDGRTIMIIGQK